MSSSLLTPDLRRILDDLARRIGVLERRITSRTAAPQAPPAVSDPIPAKFLVILSADDTDVSTVTARNVAFSTLTVGEGGTDALEATVNIGPVEIAPGGFVVPQIYAMAQPGGYRMAPQLWVANAAGTQKIAIGLSGGSGDAPPVDMDVHFPAAADFSVSSLGGDLTLTDDSGRAVVATAAGGIYWAELFCGFFST